MKNICFHCCQKGTSCCAGTQICLTTGDVLRIAQSLNTSNFFTFEIPDLAYTDYITKLARDVRKAVRPSYFQFTGWRCVFKKK